MRFITFTVLSVVCGLVPSAHAQSVIEPPPFAKTVNLSGPRFGMTALSPGVVSELEKRSIEVGSNISQFGWQFEKEFYARAAAWPRSTSGWCSSAGSSRDTSCQA